jgi:hypothetical protein
VYTLHAGCRTTRTHLSVTRGSVSRVRGLAFLFHGLSVTCIRIRVRPQVTLAQRPTLDCLRLQSCKARRDDAAARNDAQSLPVPPKRSHRLRALSIQSIPPKTSLRQRFKAFSFAKRKKIAVHTTESTLAVRIGDFYVL